MFVGSVMNEKKNKTEQTSTPPPPRLLLNGWHFHVSNMKKTIKCQKVWPPKCLLWKWQPLYSSMCTGVFLRSEYCTCQLHVQSPLVSQNDTLVTIWLQYHSDGELSVNMSTLENTDVVRRLAVLKRR